MTCVGQSTNWAGLSLHTSFSPASYHSTFHQCSKLICFLASDTVQTFIDAVSRGFISLHCWNYLLVMILSVHHKGLAQDGMWFPSLILHVKWLYFLPKVVRHIPFVVLLSGIINHFPLLYKCDKLFIVICHCNYKEYQRNL